MGMKFKKGDVVVLSEMGRRYFPEKYHKHTFTIVSQSPDNASYEVRYSTKEFTFFIHPSLFRQLPSKEKKGVIEWV